MIDQRKMFVAIATAAILIGGMAAIAYAETDTGILSQHSSESDFEGGDVELTNMSVRNSGDASIGVVSPQEGSSESFTSFQNSNYAHDFGFIITPNNEISRLDLQYREQDRNATLSIINHETTEIIEQIDLAVGSSESTIHAQLKEGEEYRVLLEPTDGEVVRSQRLDEEAPIESADFDIIDGWEDGAVSSDLWAFDSITAHKGGPTAEYVGTHSVTDAESGAVNVTNVENAGGQIEWQVYDFGWSTIDSETVTSEGVYQSDFGSLSGEEYRTVVTGERDDDTVNDWDLEIASDTLEIEAHTPEVEIISPEDGDEVSDVDLVVNVSDNDFDVRDDEEVEVTIYGNGEEIHQETISSNQTVSATWDDMEHGSNEWHVVAEDNYGLVSETDPVEISTPAELSVYDEASPSELIADRGIDATFHFESNGGQVVERTTDNGSISMEGLPVDKSFIIVVEANGYNPRRIYVENIFETQEIYLLPDNEEHQDITFELDDYVGQWPSEDTVMKIQRSLGGEWRSVEGDYFGATGEFSSQLAHNTRHRLILVNTDTGNERNIGTITPTTSGYRLIEVTTDDVLIIEDVGAEVSVSPEVRSLPAIDGAQVEINVQGRDEEIDTWSATALLEDGYEVVTLYDETHQEGGSVEAEFNLTDRAGAKVVLEVEATTVEGRTVTKDVEFTIREDFDHEYSLLNILGDGGEQIGGEGRTTFLSVIFTLMVTGTVAGRYRTSSETIGGVAIASLSAFAVIGWVGWTLIFACVVTWITLFGVRRGI